MATSTTYLASTSLFVQHIGPPEAPECPARVERILSAFAEHQLITHPDLRIIEPRSASAEEIARVHARTHIERLEHLAAHPPSTFVFVNRSGDATKQAALADDSTYFSAKSWEAAKHASGAVCDVVERVIADMRAGRASSNGFTLGRPPGHHSEPDTAQGFCLVNNVAVGAAHAKHLLGPNGRVLILDWDVHHGNGTERMFYSDPSMLYISTHLFGDRRFYPYTGAMDRCGEGDGKGFNVNIPLPCVNCGDAEFLKLWERIILVSAGFDIMEGDRLGRMLVTPTGIHRMTRMLLENIPSAQGRCILVLEGGYNVNATAEGAAACLAALLGMPAPITETDEGGLYRVNAATAVRVRDAVDQRIQEVISVQKPFWECLQ